VLNTVYMKYSLVIPAYNEERRITDSLHALDSYFSKHAKNQYEIIVVDDGSKDKTFSLLKHEKQHIPSLVIVHHKTNQGKGSAIEAGVSHARAERIAFCDADLSTPPSDILKLLNALDTVDIAIASRYLPLSTADIPFFRKVLSRIYNLLTRILFAHAMHDTQCGFKAFKKEVRPVMNRITSHHFVFDLDFLMRARSAGFSIREIPVHWTYEEGTTLKSSTPLHMLFEVLKLRVRYTLKPLTKK